LDEKDFGKLLVLININAIHGKTDFAKILKNLARYRFENNFEKK